MTSNFESNIPAEVIEYYEGETRNVLSGLIRFIEVRRGDLLYFGHDVELFMEFMIFIVNRIKKGKNLDFKSIIHLIQTRLKFPGEY